MFWRWRPGARPAARPAARSLQASAQEDHQPAPGLPWLDQLGDVAWTVLAGAVLLAVGHDDEDGRLFQTDRHRQVQHVRQPSERDAVFLYRQRRLGRAAGRIEDLCDHLPRRAGAAGQRLLVADAIQSAPFLQSQHAEALLAGHEERGPEEEPGRLADPLRRRGLARKGQGEQLAAGTQGAVLGTSDTVTGRYHCSATNGRCVPDPDSCSAADCAYGLPIRHKEDLARSGFSLCVAEQASAAMPGRSLTLTATMALWATFMLEAYLVLSYLWGANRCSLYPSNGSILLSPLRTTAT